MNIFPYLRYNKIKSYSWKTLDPSGPFILMTSPFFLTACESNCLYKRFCSTFLKKIFLSKTIMRENYKKSWRFYISFFDPCRALTLSAKRHIYNIWQSSLKTQYLHWFRRRSVDKPTLWKLLKCQYLKSESDVINGKKNPIRCIGSFQVWKFH